MTYKCQWCEMTQEDYDAYEEHVDMHANIELLNGNTFRCPLCSIVTIGSFQQWESPKAAHRQAYDHCQTPIKKKAKLCKLNTDTSSLLNINQSQVPGPSNESSTQICHGASPVEQSQLHYSFEKVGEKTFNKSTASGAKYARSSVIFPHRMAFVRGRLMQ